jgi:hypothetical protein
MSAVIENEIEDIEVCARDGRLPQRGMRYRIKIGNERLEYRDAELNDPVPTGRQIAEAAGVHPVDNYLVFQMLADGMLEGLRLDETTDLTARGVERFLVFASDRAFFFEIDGRRMEWGAQLISGMTLKKLANVDVATYGVWLEVRGQEDRPIGNNELFDLSTPGIEHFFTGIVQTTAGSAVLPARDRRYLDTKGIAYEEVEDGGQKAVIFRRMALPGARLDQPNADILVLLPAGYPDVAPDMFHALPWLKLVAAGRYPNAADVAVGFAGQQWQRWSRHNNQWRSGIDGIWTMLKRIETALAEAA